MVWRANSRAVPLVEVISEGSVWKSRVFCRRVVIIFLLRKSTTKTRRTRRKTRRNQCESVSSVLILFLSGRRSLRHERLLVNSLGAQASLPAGLGKGPSGRSKQAGLRSQEVSLHSGSDAYRMKRGTLSAPEGRTQSFCKVRQCLPAKRWLSEMSQKRPCKSPGKLNHPVNINLLSARRLWGR